MHQEQEKMLLTNQLIEAKFFHNQTISLFLLNTKTI
jgi:hypothetical protein